MALEKFRSVRGAAEVAPPATERSAPSKASSGGVAGVMIRMTPEQRKRLKTFAVEEGTPIQVLGFHALSRLLEEKGLPPL